MYICISEFFEGPNMVAITIIYDQKVNNKLRKDKWAL